uniref:Sulfotransferase n=1 Tax=Arundo donax TaxID=35708 RepID=A0A0A9CRQ6_ARUDO
MGRMTSVKANQDGEHGVGWTFKNSVFFRKGEVGDRKSHVTLEMARRLDGVVEEKLRGSGLSLTRN